MSENTGITAGLVGLILFVLFNSAGVQGQDTLRTDGYHRYYYPNGILSSEGTMKDGKPDGYWKSYYENGHLKSEGNRKDFELDSLWKFYNEDGVLIVEIYYRNGKKNGIKSTYLDKEIIRENFVNDVKEGLTKYYFPDGTLKSEIPFVKGLEQGIGKEYNANGDVITITEYKRGFIVDRMKINRRDKNNLRQGTWMTFYPNGNTHQEGTYRDDKKNGYFKDYAENGDLLKVTKYVNDVAQPEATEIQKLTTETEYYPNGKILKTTMTRNGVLEGVSREYDSSGNVVKSAEYHNGVLTGEGIVLEDGSREGPWKDLYPDGSIMAEGRYENGKPVGTWKYYHPNGKLEQTGKYNKLGKPDGTWIWYYDTGQLRREEDYQNGLKDGFSEEYDENGNLLEKGEYLDGKEDGPWIITIGDNCQKGTYRDGLRTGVWTSYQLTRNGAVTDTMILSTGGYVDDLPDGKHITYWDNGKIKQEGSYVMGKKEGNWNLFNSDGTLFLVITYSDGVETKFDGVRIKPPFEKEE
jgi:antitoxin component YwqK of YwqJK toxin-antitoxin module